MCRPPAVSYGHVRLLSGAHNRIREGFGSSGNRGNPPLPDHRRAPYRPSQDHLNEWRSPDSVRQVQPDCPPDTPISSPRHAQTAPTMDEDVGSPLDQEIEGSNPSSPAIPPSGRDRGLPDHHIWWFLIRLLDVHLICRVAAFVAACRAAVRSDQTLEALAPVVFNLLPHREKPLCPPPPRRAAIP